MNAPPFILYLSSYAVITDASTSDVSGSFNPPFKLMSLCISAHLTYTRASVLFLHKIFPVHITQIFFSGASVFFDAHFIVTALAFQSWAGSHNGFQRMHAFTALSRSLWYRNRLMKCVTASTIITWWIHSLCMQPQVVKSWNDFWGMCYLYCMCVCACIFLGI